jgi:hypothetical protein
MQVQRFIFTGLSHAGSSPPAGHGIVGINKTPLLPVAYRIF